ncbi:MAG TPA: CHAT domain-containing protein [Fimbriimonadaceae bacterium]|nr:CHAT domain-containing protein [Fimbriimonadaceae bacterium]
MLSPVEAVQLVETGEALPNGIISGFGRAFFARVAELLGTDPAQAIRLASRWAYVLAHCDDHGFVFRAKGGGERAESRWAESASSFLKAGEVAHDPMDQLRFQIGAIDSLARSGDIEGAVTLGSQLAKGLADQGDFASAARAMLNLGNALVWADRYSEAADQYRGALQHLHRSSPEGSAALLGLATSGLYSGPLEDVRVTASEARNYFSRDGLKSYVVQCDLTLAQVETLTGMPDAAIARLSAHLGAALDRDSSARLHELLGDACLTANVHEQAIVHYDRARTAYGNPLGVAGCDLGKARCLLAQGQFARAIAAFDDAVSGFQSVGNTPWALAAKVGQSEARRRSGDIETAQRLLVEPLDHLADGFLRCLALIENAEQQIEVGDSVKFQELESAVRSYASVPLGWQVCWIRARIETETEGRLGAFRSMITALLESRAMTRSTATSIAFLRDKEVALRAYLDLLVGAGLQEELREVVLSTRAVGVLDEISASRLGIDLDEQRSTPEDDNEIDTHDGRRLGPKVDSGMRPGWGSMFATVLNRFQVEQSHPGSLLVEAGGQVWLSTPGKLFSTGVPLAALRRALKWLTFELTDPSGDFESLTSHLETLRPLLQHLDDQPICPDSLTWQVPWAVIGSREVEVSLVPGITSEVGPLGADAKCLLVVGDCGGLTHSSAEIDLVRRQFADTKVVDSAHAFAMAEGRYDLVHVVGHARQNSENPMFSTLLFPDGAMTSAEIARLGIRAQFVVLSACETGRVETVLPGEPGGLARGFIARGAQRVIANQWPVDDEAAYRFVSALYPHWVCGASLVDSVAFARQACRDWKEHAYYWGAPVVFCGVSEASS